MHWLLWLSTSAALSAAVAEANVDCWDPEKLKRMRFNNGKGEKRV